MLCLITKDMAESSEWVVCFYQRVDSAAAAHCVRRRKAEVLGNSGSCIFVASTEAAVQ